MPKSDKHQHLSAGAIVMDGMDNLSLLRELERKIGAPPGTRLDPMENYVDSEGIVHNRRAAMIQWLLASGVPPYRVEGIKIYAIAAAYQNRNYLAKMKQGGYVSGTKPPPRGTRELDLSALGDDETPLQQADSITATTAQIARAAEIVIGSYIKALEQKLGEIAQTKVETAIEAYRPTLSENLKGQIRNLVSESARDAIAAALPPRRIEVVQSNGTAIEVGLQHERFPLLLKACSARNHKGYAPNIWLTGPTGSGKTTGVEFVAKALALSFYLESSLDADYKVIGHKDAYGNVVRTQFRECFEFGGIFCADEIDNWTPSALVAMNAALANDVCAFPDGLVRRHHDCIVIACANTWGLGATADYVGRSRLDAATLNRFLPKIDWPYDERLEMAVAETQGGSDWARLVLGARKAAAARGLKIIISPRDTFAGIALLRAGFSPAEVCDMTFAAPLTEEQKQSLEIEKLLRAMAIGPKDEVAEPVAAPSFSSNTPIMRALYSQFTLAIDRNLAIAAIKALRSAFEASQGFHLELRGAKNAVEDILNDRSDIPDFTTFCNMSFV